MSKRQIRNRVGGGSMTGKKKREFTGIVPSHQTPLIEYTSYGAWLIWLSYNRDRTDGTYLLLQSDGGITREMLNGGEVVSVIMIKPGRER